MLGVNLIYYEKLKGYRRRVSELKILKWKVKKLKSDIQFLNDAEQLDDVQQNKLKLKQVIEELAIVENEVTKLDKEQQISMVLINLFDGNYREILKKKYVEGKTLEVIAEEMNYSHGYVRSRHAELKRQFDFLNEWDVALNNYNALKAKYEGDGDY